MVKRHSWLRRLYRANSERIHGLLAAISPKLMNRVLYFETFKRLPKYKNPKRFNDKLNALAVTNYYYNPLVSKCADKYAVREYIAEKGLSSILIPLIGCWEKPEDIEWDKLPNKFVLKGNHGSGLNILCTDKSQFDRAEAIKTMNGWLKREYWKRSGELFYRNIPKRIVCETFIETKDGFPPRDYKFFCEKGEVKFLFVAQERVNGNVKINYLTPKWEVLPVELLGHPRYVGDIPKPANMDEMMRVASIISKDFPFVRVDLYSENEIIYFGEITFMAGAGRNIFLPDKYDEIFGSMFEM